MLNIIKFNFSKHLIRNYSTNLNNQVIDSITKIFGKKNFTISESVRQHYSKDESLHKYLIYIFTNFLIFIYTQ